MAPNRKKRSTFGRKKPSSNNRKFRSEKLMVVPPIYPNKPIRRTVRFVSTAAFAGQTFTQQDLYSQFLTVVAVTGNAISFADMVRIRGIKIWIQNFVTPGAQFTIQPLSGDVNNQFASPERTYTLVSSSSAQPSFLHIKPKGKDDPLGGWKESNNVNFAQTMLVASWTGGLGLTIDFDFDVILNTVGGPNGYAVITTTTVLGTLGGRGIFGGNMNISGSNQL